MPSAELNGITVNYQVTGEGDLVVLVMGTGSPGSVWTAHQVPAFVAAGYRVATFDNRGIPPTDECADGFTVDDMVGDTAALIEHLGGGPARVAGTSLGARITQELALARPDLVSHAALLATYGRPDPLRTALSLGERELHDSGVKLPSKYHAAITALRYLSPTTLADPRTARDWLDLFEYGGSTVGAGVRAQMALNDFTDRLTDYHRITTPCLAIGFTDDRTLPPHLAREVADAIPNAKYAEVPNAGHLGYMEQPDKVNALVLDFFKS
ncbi:alpha/beta fold hydrolase [Umezawaea tangerina]|uniref:Pimeloyl-ACP methyl ester carboxylesterase n=1 Tax=Umezawaea tangerina TaxID=84725 RepID=A0A2T0T9J9_9PSEU|nr:alpha/beta fold hydrolase [Umezawaea tangerina]PRY42341.1 pimeloyl-ACP methyl ester carboxylesterase [Umezawaea tangerina]